MNATGIMMTKHLGDDQLDWPAGGGEEEVPVRAAVFHPPGGGRDQADPD